MLFDRASCSTPSETVEIEVRGDRQAAVVGRRPQQVPALAEGDRALRAVGRARPASCASAAADYHQILKAKFGLTDR